ncbi:PREDICTED: serine/threonine-protein kinase pim-1-like, partial [Acanthisitta chloris]|uniref:serine/threonine-protein kinase pim-1-like n=1 Tax=Acanthisitta chloris TaxID=57068 RepID=UPI0004F0DA3D
GVPDPWHGISPTDGIVVTPQPDGTRVPLEIVLLDRGVQGFHGIIQLLDWIEIPDRFLLVMERPEQSQGLFSFIKKQKFLTEDTVWELFHQLLHCASCGILHQDIKPEDILLDLATGKVKLIDFGILPYSPLEWIHLKCYHGEAPMIWSLGILLYQMNTDILVLCKGKEKAPGEAVLDGPAAGNKDSVKDDNLFADLDTRTLPYSPPEWICLKCYHDDTATIWSLGILLYQMVCGKNPFRKGQDIIWGSCSHNGSLEGVNML